MLISYLQNLYNLISPSNNNNNNNNNNNFNNNNSSQSTPSNDFLLSIPLSHNCPPSSPQPILSINTNGISKRSTRSSCTHPSSPLSLPSTYSSSSSSLLSRSFSSSSRSSSSSYKPLSPRATQDLISRLDATSSLLPQNIANFITAASLAARVSLRSSAFCIELVIETLRYSTSTSLGITRRALISAVGSARAVNYKSKNSLNLSSSADKSNHSGYLHVLDHYTNVGIYLVHHVFTMAELLSLAGLDLTNSVISTGFETAQLSVMLLDSIFGSNESSRALSAIIMLVRRELLHDPNFTPSHSGTISGLVALTKATIAFACLQLATSRRTTSTMKMRVVWDATIITQSEVESESLNNGIDYQLGISQGRAHEYQCSEFPPSPTSDPDSISALPSPTTPRHHHRQSTSQSSQTSEPPSFVTDLQSETGVPNRSTVTKRSRMTSFSSNIATPHSLPQTHCDPDREQIEFELTQLLAEDEDQSQPDDYESSIDEEQSNVDQQLPEDVRKALYEVSHPSDSRTSSGLRLSNTEALALTDSHIATYQLTAMTTTTTTMTTRTTTTTTTAHPNSSIENLCPTSSPKSSHESQLRWGTSILHTSSPESHTFNNSTMTNIPTTELPRKRTFSNSRVGEPEINVRSKSMPSSPQRSRFTVASMQTVMRHSLTRSKTHSDLTSVYFRPHSLVCPVPNFFSSESPSSSPYVTPAGSSQQSDELTPEHENDSRPISEIYQDDEGELDLFDMQDHSHHPFSPVVSPRAPRRPALISPQLSSPSVQTVRTYQASQAVSPTAQPPQSDFPPQSLIKNLGRFMRYSSAAYGQQFMRIMGIGVDSFNYPNTKKHSANDHAFASHVRLPVDQIILSSFAEPNPILGNETLSPLVHYVTIDHDVKAVVLTCRGTLGLSDVLVDLTCEYEPILVDGGDPNSSYLAHSGMLHSALRLRQESSTVHEVIKQALIDHPSYGLIITGHSLGGGVAALLAVLCSTRSQIFLEQNRDRSNQVDHPAITTRFVTSFRSGFPPGRPIHSYTYGTPAVASLDLSEYTKGLVTTVCNGIDIVPTLSLGVLHDLKSVAVSLHEEQNIAMDIVTKVVGLYRPNRKSWPKSDRQGAPHPAREPLDEDGERVDKENVELKDHEIENGVGDNRANSRDYLDPALQGSEFGQAESHPDLGDWLWSLRRTMKAVSDAEKLYPPGDVWHVESYEVFVVKEDKDKSMAESVGRRGSLADAFSRKGREGRRIILRACDDVQARFSEPIFGKTMFHDHIPFQYELVLELLEAAVAPSTSS